MKIVISIHDQNLTFTDGDTKLVYPVSTSKFGEGFEEGSGKTPTGMFSVCEKIGANAESGMIFISRKPTGKTADIGKSEKDVITSRIIRLEGMDKSNSNTFKRYIYIHGTSDEENIGKKASFGCVRMKNDDIIELFSRVEKSCSVYIN